MTTVARTAAAAAAAVIVFGCAVSEASAGLWSAPATLGPAGASARGDVVVDRSGTAAVAWVASDGTARATVRPPGGVFTTETTLAAGGAGAPAVALDGNGRALVAWAQNGSLGMAQHTPGTPGFAQILAGVAGVEGDPDVAFVGAGTAVVVWAGSDGAIHALSSSVGGGIAASPISRLARATPRRISAPPAGWPLPPGRTQRRRRTS